MFHIALDALWFEIGKMTMAKESKGILIGNKIYLVGGFNKKALNTKGKTEPQLSSGSSKLMYIPSNPFVGTENSRRPNTNEEILPYRNLTRVEMQGSSNLIEVLWERVFRYWFSLL